MANATISALHTANPLTVVADPDQIIWPVSDLSEATALAQAKAVDLTFLDNRYAGAGTFLAVANNLSDVADAAIARQNLGVEIGVDVQAFGAVLDDLNTLGASTADGEFLVATGAGALAWESGATARTSLGLGSIATQNDNNVTITGGSISGITDLAIADGGTGQSTAQAAIDALTQVSAATNEHVLTKDTASGNAIWKAAAGGGGTPGGADTQVQFNDSGAFGGDADLVWNKTTNILTATGTINASTALQLGGANINTGGTLSNVAYKDQANTFTAAQTVNVTSTAALKVELLSNNTLVVDTTNARVGIGTQPATGSNTGVLHIKGAGTGTAGRTWSRIENTQTSSGAGVQMVNGDGRFAGFQYTGSTYVVGEVFSIFTSDDFPVKFTTYGKTASGGTSSILFSPGGNDNEAMRVTSSKRLGIGTTSPTAKLHVDQDSTTDAIPVLTLDQADVDQVLAKIIGTSDSGAVDRTLVKASDFPTAGSIVAWVQVAVQDDRVGGITAGDYYIPLYSAPS